MVQIIIDREKLIEFISNNFTLIQRYNQSAFGMDKEQSTLFISNEEEKKILDSVEFKVI